MKGYSEHMEKKTIIPVILLLIPLVSGYVNWLYDTDLDTACEMAKAENKLVLLYIYDEWTENMDNVFNDKEVSEYINGEFYAMKLYKNTSKDICDQYNIKKAPTVLFLNPYKKEIGRIEGYMDPDEFYIKMKTIIESKEFIEKLRDEAYEALTDADSLYSKGEYSKSKEQYTIAMNKFHQLKDKEKEEYCRSMISKADMKMQLVLLRYGLIAFVGVVAFFAFVYYLSARK